MKAGLCVRPMLAIGLVAVVAVVGAGEDDPSTADKEKQKRQDQQFQESLGWYEAASARNPAAKLKPQPVLRWTNATRGQKGEPTLILWTDAGRPEALASVYPWSGNLIYESVSLAREKGFTLKENGRTVWSPDEPGVTFRDVPDAPVPADAPAARLKQARAVAERFKVAIGSGSSREELRLLPRPIYRYDMAEAKPAHPDLIDGAAFAFVQGTDPEAVLLVEAVRRGDRMAWQYAFGRATTWAIEAKLGPSTVWTTPTLERWSDPRSANFVLARPLVE